MKRQSTDFPICCSGEKKLMSSEKKSAMERMSLALADMLRTTPIEQIFVKELCERACVNRSTFYRHFDDVYALLAHIWSEINQAYLDKIHCPGLSEHEALVRLFEFSRQNHAVMSAVFRLTVLGRPLPNCANFVHFTLVERCPPEKADYLQAAMASMFYHWLLEKDPIPAASLAQMIIDVADGLSSP